MPLVYRICKKRYPVFDATGSLRVGGRWTSPGLSVLYTAEHFATAILEQLVHAGSVALAGAHHAAAIHIPDSINAERIDPEELTGWVDQGSVNARQQGDDWARRARTAILWVPSLPGRPVEWNVLVNLSHPHSRRIRVRESFDLAWDNRLFVASD